MADRLYIYTPTKKGLPILVVEFDKAGRVDAWRHENVEAAESFIKEQKAKRKELREKMKNC